MAKHSKIEWTHHTFNPWWGCAKVSPACAHCYAETWARRLALELWGRSSSRRYFGDDYWLQPVRWNKEAQRAGVRRRVFCASMADVFEGRSELDIWRERLWPLVEGTPWLDWLLLTKRPQNVARMVPWQETWPANVWLGVTAENQRWAERRIPILLGLPARIKFISAEPLLGRLSLSQWTGRAPSVEPIGGLDWVIAGGESGHGARPTHPDWVRALRDECQQAKIAFHFKQWGHWTPTVPRGVIPKQTITLGDDSRRPGLLYGVGKTIAGRSIDGATWDQFPT